MNPKAITVSLVGVLFAMGALLTCSKAQANGGPSNYLIHDLMQNGQDVEFIVKSKSPNVNLSLLRQGEDYEKILFENEAIMEGVEPTQNCWDGSPWCLPEQEDCHDCDGDGVTECPIGIECIDAYIIHYQDKCVYPGKTEYRLYTGEIGGDYAHNRFIDVEDTGTDCDYDITFDDDDEKGGCSVSKLGTGEPVGLGLVLLMLVTGIVALRRRR